MGLRPLVACPHCARLHVRLPIEAGAVASCVRCGFPLYRQSRLSLNDWTAVLLGALAVFFLATFLPLASLYTQGYTINATLMDALVYTWQQGRPGVVIMCALFVVAFPLGQILFLLWAIRAIVRRKLPDDFHLGLRVLHAIAPWSMIPVLLLGMIVALVKLAGMVSSFSPGPGLWAMATLTVMMTILSRVTAHRLWRHAEDDGLVPLSGADLHAGRPYSSCQSCGYVQPDSDLAVDGHCVRCDARVHARKPGMHSKVWALLIAACIIYIPANIMPVMTVRLPTGTVEHTILGGVVELWRLGSWDLAIIVFVASVVVPMAKLLGLAVLMVRSRWRGRLVQRQRTRLYELVEFVGQWSMLDVFVVLLIGAMADFPGLARITAGPGAFSFGLVVILTMFAARSYDPRRGWDAEPAGSAADDTVAPTAPDLNEEAT